MLDLKLAPLIAGTIISKRAWNRIPTQYHEPMLAAAREAGMKLRNEIRSLGSQSIKEMKKRGLEVTQLDKVGVAAWQTFAESTYSKLRGSYCPADLFDEVKQLRDEFRIKSK